MGEANANPYAIFPARRLARFYCPMAKCLKGEEVKLDASESSHLYKVLRLGVGDRCELFDGKGKAYLAEIIDTGAHVSCKILDEGRFAGANLPILIAPAILKGKAMSFLAEKCAEFGARALLPWLSRRSVPRLRETAIKKFEQKLRERMIGACKQSGNNFLPKIKYLGDVCEFIKYADEFADEGGLLAYASLESGGEDLLSVFAKNAEQIEAKGLLLVLGAEGDFAPEESELLRAANFLPLSLGEGVLRAESAAICALATMRSWQNQRNPQNPI